MSLKRGSVLGLLVLCLVLVGTIEAQAQGNSGGNRGNRYGTTQTVEGDGGGLSAIRTQMAAMQAQLDQALTKIALLQAALNAEVSARQTGDATLQTTLAGITPGVSLETLNAAIAVEAGARLTADASLEGQIANEVAARAAADATFAPLSSVTPLTALVPLASYVTVASGDINGLAGPHVIFSGANVHVRNSWGSSFTQNGLGNLVLGYNEPSGYVPEERGGSHNLVVGPNHRYNSPIGLITGYANKLGAMGASVTGGVNNTASGQFSSVTGGSENVASGQVASVAGGYANEAAGSAAAVSGGNGNRATGDFSSVSGGLGNTAGTAYSTAP